MKQKPNVFSMAKLRCNLLLIVNEILILIIFKLLCRVTFFFENHLSRMFFVH
jgi:hypothetical protein